MKEASGELNMTLITIVAIALIGGIFALLYPQIKTRIEKTWGGGSNAIEAVDGTNPGLNSAGGDSGKVGEQ